MAGITTICDDKIRQLCREAMDNTNNMECEYIEEKVDHNLLQIYRDSMASTPNKVKDIHELFKGCPSPLMDFDGDDNPEKSTNAPKDFLSSTKKILRACWGCNKRDAPFRCSGCHTITYCSRECQKKHWKTHKEGCKQVQLALSS